MSTVKIKIWLSLFIIGAIQTYYSNAEVRIVCYYTNWSVYRPGTAKFNPQNINPYLCTHLIYAFGGFTKDNTLKPFDKYQDIEKGGYAKFTGLKTYNKNLKTLIAIGGWNEGSSRFSSLVASADKRKEFVKNVVKFLRVNHFDGLDLDWEYPSFRDGGKPYDKENYALLVQELREEFEREASKTGRPKLLLTMAVPAGIEYIKKGFDVEKLNKYLDWMNILSYDYHSAFEPSVNHHAPLYPLEEDNEYNYDAELNIDHTINYYLEAGADRQKLVLGIPTYGRSYTLFNPDANEIGAPADGPGEMGDATKEKGYLAYYEICENIKNNPEWKVVQPNPDAMGPYAYKDDQWVGYDDENIVRLKAKFVAEQDLGGIMFWSIDNDDFRGKCHGRPYPLIEAAKEALIESSSNLISSEERVSIRSRKRPTSVTSKVIESSNVVQNSGGRQTISQSTVGRSRIRGDSRYNSRSQNQFDDDITSTRTSTRRRVSSSRSKPNQRRQSQRRTTVTTTTTTTPVPSPLTLVTPSYTTPPPPATPDSGSDFKCEDEGFFPHPSDCKKYFWCLSSGPSELGIVAHQFTCPAGLYFNKAADSCDYSRNVLCNKKSKPASTTTTTTTEIPKTASTTTPRTTTARTRAPITAATSKTTFRFTPSTTTTPIPDVYEDDEYEYYDDEDDAPPRVFDSEEDPRVIKELIALIKKVGGVQELEKQLLSNDGNAANDKTTPPAISKSLYERVLSARNNNNGAQINSGSKTVSGTTRTSSQNFRNGGQFIREEQEVNRGKPQYVTINRSRQRTSDADSSKEENSRLYSTNSNTEESLIQTDSNTNAQLPTYVTIARTRSKFEQSTSAESPNESTQRVKEQRIQNSNQFRTNSEMPEYVTIARSNIRKQDEKIVNEDVSDEDEVNIKKTYNSESTGRTVNRYESVKNVNMPEYVSTTNFRTRVQNEQISPELSSELNLNKYEKVIEDEVQTTFSTSADEASSASKSSAESTATSKYQTINRSRSSFTSNTQSESQSSDEISTQSNTNEGQQLLLSVKGSESLNSNNKETVAIAINSSANKEKTITEEGNAGTTETVDILLKPLLNIPAITEESIQNVNSGSNSSYVEKTVAVNTTIDESKSSSSADKTIPLLQQARPFSITNKSVLDETTTLKVSENYTNSDAYTSRGSVLTPHGFVLGHNGSTNSNYNITKIDTINLNNDKNTIKSTNKLNVTVNKLNLNATSELRTSTSAVPTVRTTENNQNRLATQSILNSRNSNRFGVRTQESVSQNSLQSSNVTEIENKTETSNSSRSTSRINTTPFNGRRVVSRFRTTTTTTTTARPITVSEQETTQTRNIRNRGRVRLTTTTSKYDNEEKNSSVERTYRPRNSFRDLSSLTAADIGRSQINSSNRFRVNRRRPATSTTTVRTPSTVSTPVIRTTQNYTNNAARSSSFGNRRQFSSNNASVRTSTTTENAQDIKNYVLKPRGNRIVANPIKYTTKLNETSDNFTATNVESQNTVNSTTKTEESTSISSQSTVSKTNVTHQEDSEDVNEQIHLSESNIRETDSIGREVNQIVKPTGIVRRRKIIRKQRPIASTLDFTTETNELIMVDNVDTKVTNQRDGVTEPNVIVRTRKIVRKLRPVSENNSTTTVVSNAGNKRIINNSTSTSVNSTEINSSSRTINNNATNGQKSQSRFNIQRKTYTRPVQNNTSEGFTSSQTSRRRFQSSNANRIITRPTLEVLKTSSTHSLVNKHENETSENQSEQSISTNFTSQSSFINTSTSSSTNETNVKISNADNLSITTSQDDLLESQRITTTELDEEITTGIAEAVDLQTEADITIANEIDASTTTYSTTLTDNEDFTTQGDFAVTDSLLIADHNEDENVSISQSDASAVTTSNNSSKITTQSQGQNTSRTLYRRPNERTRTNYNGFGRTITNNARETVVANSESTNNKINSSRRRYSTPRPTTTSAPSYQNRRKTVTRTYTPRTTTLTKNNGRVATTYRQNNFLANRRANKTATDETEESNLLNATTENNEEYNDEISKTEASISLSSASSIANKDSATESKTVEITDSSLNTLAKTNEETVQEENVIHHEDHQVQRKFNSNNRSGGSSTIQIKHSELLSANESSLLENENQEELHENQQINILTSNQSKHDEHDYKIHNESSNSGYEKQTRLTSLNASNQQEQTKFANGSQKELISSYSKTSGNQQLSSGTSNQRELVSSYNNRNLKNKQSTYGTGAQKEQVSTYTVSAEKEQTSAHGASTQNQESSAYGTVNRKEQATSYNQNESAYETDAQKEEVSTYNVSAEQERTSTYGTSAQSLESSAFGTSVNRKEQSIYNQNESAYDRGAQKEQVSTYLASAEQGQKATYGTSTQNQESTAYRNANRKEQTTNYGQKEETSYNANLNKNKNTRVGISNLSETSYTINQQVPQRSYIGLSKTVNQSTQKDGLSSFNKNTKNTYSSSSTVVNSHNQVSEDQSENSRTVQLPNSILSVHYNEQSNANKINSEHSNDGQSSSRESTTRIGSSKFSSSQSSVSSSSNENTETSTNLVHVFAESFDTTTDGNIYDSTRNDLSDESTSSKNNQRKLIEVNRVVEVNYKENDANQTIKVGTMLETPEVDKIGEINRITVIKIVDGNITHQTGDENLFLSETSALRNFLNSTQPVTITTKIKTSNNVTSAQVDNSTINDLLTAHLHAIEDALVKDDKTGRKIRIDSQSRVANTYTLQPDFTEITTLALEALFQKEKTAKSATLNDIQTPLPTLKQVVTDNEPVESQKQLLNIRVLKQDEEDIGRAIKFTEDANILPIRILNSRQVDNREPNTNTNESNVVYLLKNSPFIDSNISYSVVKENGKRENRSSHKGLTIKSDKMGGFITTNNPKTSTLSVPFFRKNLLRRNHTTILKKRPLNESTTTELPTTIGNQSLQKLRIRTFKSRPVNITTSKVNNPTSKVTLESTSSVTTVKPNTNRFRFATRKVPAFRTTTARTRSSTSSERNDQDIEPSNQKSLNSKNLLDPTADDIVLAIHNIQAAPLRTSTETDRQPKTIRTRPTRPAISHSKPVEKIVEYIPVEQEEYYEEDDTDTIKLLGKDIAKGKVLIHPSGKIQCLDQGNFPHPVSCRKFISCAKMENGAVIGWEYTCPKNLSFDPIGGICNWAAGLGCVS